MEPAVRASFERWLEALAERHLPDLRHSDLTRAIRSLSTRYVTRRGARGAPTGTGARAAFATYYAPLHFLVVHEIVRALDPEVRDVGRVLDLGCGSGAGGAAWALACPTPPNLVGIDRSAWARREARWTYRTLSLRGRSAAGDLATHSLPAAGWGVLAAYALNELPTERIEGVAVRLVGAARRGVRLLVVEPAARRLTPWWDALVERVVARGGRADSWRFPVELPERLSALDRSVGLDHRELTARSLYLPSG